MCKTCRACYFSHVYRDSRMFDIFVVVVEAKDTIVLLGITERYNRQTSNQVKLCTLCEIFGHLHIHTHSRTHTRTHARTHTYTHTHTHTHNHTHTSQVITRSVQKENVWWEYWPIKILRFVWRCCMTCTCVLPAPDSWREWINILRLY